jgi:hypothetical protein
VLRRLLQCHGDLRPLLSPRIADHYGNTALHYAAGTIDLHPVERSTNDRMKGGMVSMM